MKTSVNPSSRRTTAAHALAAEHAAAGPKSLGRGLAVLRLVSSAGPGGLKVSEIAMRSGLHVATAHRQLAALTREGFIAQDTATRSYMAGPELLAMAFQAQHRYGLDSAILPVLERLAELTGDVVYATTRAGECGPSSSTAPLCTSTPARAWLASSTASVPR